MPSQGNEADRAARNLAKPKPNRPPENWLAAARAMLVMSITMRPRQLHCKETAGSRGSGGCGLLLARSRADIRSRFRIHVLRYTAALLMIQSGYPPKMLQ